MISITKKNLPSIEKVIKKIKFGNSSVGSIFSFIGFVRDFQFNEIDHLDHLNIEHYEGMTQISLQNIEKEANLKWNLIDTIIIHRVGIVKLNEPIVYIIVASSHRDDAFDACRYIIDYLKIKAPFWKKEISKNQSSWVEQKDSDLVKIK